MEGAPMAPVSSHCKAYTIRICFHRAMMICVLLDPVHDRRSLLFHLRKSRRPGLVAAPLTKDQVAKEGQDKDTGKGQHGQHLDRGFTSVIFFFYFFRPRR
jgi:hypothetical protein